MHHGSGPRLALAFLSLALLSEGVAASTEPRWVPIPERREAGVQYTPAEIERGRVVYRQCAACHSIGKHKTTSIGPELDGIVGRRAASIESFAFSSAFKKAGEEGLVWTADLLDRFLRRPSRMIEGNTMAFAGITSAKDRQALIAYLSRFKGPKFDPFADLPDPPPLPVRQTAYVSPTERPAGAAPATSEQ